MKIGDLVKWYELHDDSIVKDAGIGLVVGHMKYEIFNETVLYKVLRSKHNDIVKFEGHTLEIIKENENET